MQYKAVIFDKDGVIVDSEPLQHRASQEILADYGYVYTIEDHKILAIGKAGNAYYPIIQEHYGITDIEVFRQRRRDRYIELAGKHLKMRRGVLTLIRRLFNAWYPLAVASGSSKKLLAHDLAKFKLNQYFKVIVSGENYKSKPDPEIFLVAAEKLGVKPSECIVIEDSEVGVKAAKSTGMYCIAIPHELTAHQDFSIADEVASSFAEISLFKKLLTEQ